MCCVITVRTYTYQWSLTVCSVVALIVVLTQLGIYLYMYTLNSRLLAKARWHHYASLFHNLISS